MNRWGSQSALGNGFDAGRGAAFLPLAFEFGDVAANGAAGKATGLVEIAQLNGFIAVFLLRPHLKDVAGPGLDHGHRHHLAGRIENLRHPDLSAEQSNCHRSMPLCYVADGNGPAHSRVCPPSFRP